MTQSNSAVPSALLINYLPEEREWVEWLNAQFDHTAYRCWLTFRHYPDDARWPLELEAGLRRTLAVLDLQTPQSTGVDAASLTRRVRDVAREKRVPIVPLICVPCPPSHDLAHTPPLDFTNDRELAFEELVAHLNTIQRGTGPYIKAAKHGTSVHPMREGFDALRATIIDLPQLAPADAQHRLQTQLSKRDIHLDDTTVDQLVEWSTHRSLPLALLGNNCPSVQSATQARDRIPPVGAQEEQQISAVLDTCLDWLDAPSEPASPIRIGVMRQSLRNDLESLAVIAPDSSFDTELADAILRPAPTRIGPVQSGPIRSRTYDRETATANDTARDMVHTRKVKKLNHEGNGFYAASR